MVGIAGKGQLDLFIREPIGLLSDLLLESTKLARQ